MRDVNLVKKNISKMIEQNAPESDIDQYVASEGYTPEMLQGKQQPQAPQTPTQQPAEGFQERNARVAGQFAMGLPNAFGNALIGGIQAGADIGDKAIRLIDKAYFGDSLSNEKLFGERLAKQVKLRNQQQSQLPPAERAGIAIGQVAPYLSVGTGTGMKVAAATGSRIAGLAAGGAAGGAVSSSLSAQEQAGLENRAVETLKGAAAGGAVGGGLGVGVKVAQATPALVKIGVQKLTGIKPELAKAFQDAGVSPRLADISTSKPTKAFQNLLEVFPGSASTIQKATQNQVDEITKQLAGITKSSGGTMQQAGKQILEGAKNFKEVVKKRVGDLYDDLDQHILTESQKATEPKLLDAIDEWTNLKELESNLIGSVSGRTGIASEINKQANKQLGFWRNRTRAEGSEFLTNAADDAKGLANVKKQITNQEKIISGYEKYMSPQQFESALMSGNAKISTNNLKNLTQDPQIQDIAAVGAGDTERVLSRYSQIVDEAGNISYPRLKIFRSTVGAKLESPSLSGDERAGIKKIYGALSEDMKAAVVANGGEKGLQAFNKANKAFARSQDFLEKNINPLIEDKVPEKVYQMAMAGIKQGGSNIKPIMKTLNPTQQEFVRGTVIKNMGLQNTGLQDETGAVFSPNKFLTEWNKLDNEMNREAVQNIFTKPQIESIRKLNAAISNIKETSKIAQKSQNLPYASWTMLGLGVLASPVSLIQAGGAVAGAKISAKLMTSPKFVNWLAQTPKVPTKEIPKHLRMLSIMASQNPDIREDVFDYLDSITIASDANAAEIPEDEAMRRYKEAAPTTKYMPDQQEIRRILGKPNQQSKK
jgi:hypothetical protein